MLYLVTLLAVFGNGVLSGPLSSCYDQAYCIDLKIEDAGLDSDGDQTYNICLFFDDSLPGCDKEGTISHACAVGSDGIYEEGDKVEGLESGDDESLCDTIKCGTQTVFGFKDGSSCEAPQLIYMNFSNPDYDREAICSTGFGCNSKGKNQKACKWYVPAPDCDDDTETTQTPQEPEEPETPETPEDPCDDCTTIDVSADDGLTCVENCGCMAVLEGSDAGCHARSSSGTGYPAFVRAEGDNQQDFIVPDEITAEDEENTATYNNDGTSSNGANDNNKITIIAIVASAVFGFLHL